MSKKCQNISRTLKIKFKTFFEHFWDQKWAPARAARTARTPRPIFDHKKCSKMLGRLCGWGLCLCPGLGLAGAGAGILNANI